MTERVPTLSAKKEEEDKRTGTVVPDETKFAVIREMFTIFDRTLPEALRVPTPRKSPNPSDGTGTILDVTV